MPPIISDPPPVVYLLLAFVVIVTGAIAAQRQDRKSGLTFFASLVALATVFVLDRLLESPREEAVHNSMAMAAAADTNNPDEFLKHIADPLVYHGADGPKPATRSELKASPFWQMLRQFNVHVAVWNFSRDDVKEIDDNTIEIGFMAKGEARGEMKQVPLYVRATFKRQSDGKMRMTDFRTFDPVDHTKPFTIPNFPK